MYSFALRVFLWAFGSGSHLNFWPISIEGRNLLLLCVICRPHHIAVWAFTNVLGHQTYLVSGQSQIREVCCITPVCWQRFLFFSLQVSRSAQQPLCAGHSELTAPSFPWRSGVFGTTAYFILAHGLSDWSPQQAKALITTLFIVHGILADISRQPLDFTAPIASLLHFILNIPMPEAALPVAMDQKQSTKGEDSKKIK